MVSYTPINGVILLDDRWLSSFGMGADIPSKSLGLMNGICSKKSLMAMAMAMAMALKLSPR